MAGRALKPESFHCSQANCLCPLRRARAKWPGDDASESVLHLRTGKLELKVEATWNEPGRCAEKMEL
jgi:hypothetical protein